MLVGGSALAGATRSSPITTSPLPVSSPASPDPSAAAASDTAQAGASPAEAVAVGDAVQLLLRPTYLKSADPMPMLRPPDLIDEGEVGVVVELRSLDQLAVRFRRGTFLLSVSQLRRART